MQPRVKQIACSLLATSAVWALLAPPCRAQSAVVIACQNRDRCTYQRGHAATVQGSDSIKLLSPGAFANPQSNRGRSGRVSSLPGLYRDPESGALRVLNVNGGLGDVVLPSKVPHEATAGSTAQTGWPVEYREQPKSKTRVSVSADHFVALLRDPRPDGGVVEFAKREANAGKPHPAQQQLIAGAILFARDSEELRDWREELKATMRRGLDLFRAEGVDPARLEATLAEGVSATRIFRMVAPDAKEQSLEEELVREHRRLTERFTIALTLKNAGMHDAFLEKLDQIGLARWSRPDLIADVEKALQASAQWHHRKAKELFDAKQYGGAFDEARLASNRLPCDDTISEFYYGVRIEFVNRNMIPARPDYEHQQRSILQQIVRELQGIGQEPLTSERIEYARKRIAEGERLDKGYLPLQLKKAEFLANVGELTASREVVTRIERTVSLGRTEVEDWLHMDASLNGKLQTLRPRTERLATEQIANGQFREAMETAAIGLSAEPANPRFLYLSAVSAAVLRDQQRTRDFVETYLRRRGADCADATKARSTLFDLYRRQVPDAGPRRVGTPNWISGELYPAGEASYDAISGSFNPRIVSSIAIDDPTATSTHFRWEGFLAASIQTMVGPTLTARQPTLELEPVYDPKRVYMSGIGTRASSEAQRRIMPLRYLNSPDYDPILSAKFTGKRATRGWAANPFFHPFLWNGIFLFDLEYDELARIKEAIPVPPDASRPTSPFSERLTFTWEGNTRRLLAINGARYRRELIYNDRGVLVSEKITYPSGRGRVEYKYRGNPMQLAEVECEDNFYDRTRRIVHIAPLHR